MEKVFIKNRKDQKIAVIIEKPKNQKGLAFVMHGLGGFKEQDHVKVMSDAFLDRGFVAIRFDVANTLGESDGRYEDATVTNYLEDLEDVIRWAKTQDWYQEPFGLAGHSLGGICTSLYTQSNPKKVSLIAPTSTVVSGELSTQTDRHRKIEKEWERSGWHVTESKSKPGLMKRLPWSHMVDRLKYDLIPGVDKMTMPVMLAVGSEDEGTPLEHQQLLFDKLPGPKELHVIKGSGHTFREPEHLEELREIFDKWLEKYA